MKKVTGLFVALIATIVMVSCVEKKSFEMLAGEWNVVAVGEMAVPDSADAFMGFNIAEQLVYGFTGCNHLTGTLPAKVDAKAPLFAAIGSTRKMCVDMSVEDALLPALGQVVDFNVHGDNLYFLDAEGKVMVSLVKR